MHQKTPDKQPVALIKGNKKRIRDHLKPDDNTNRSKPFEAEAMAPMKGYR
jgi:hypothetical protein